MCLKNKIKLIVCDLDGTLLNSKAIISDKNANALHEAYRQNIKIAFCSGRQAADIEYMAKSINISDCMILSLNGSYCKLNMNGELFINKKLSDDSVTKCLNIFNKYNVSFNCYCGDILINNTVPEYENDKAFWNEERQKRRKLIKHLYGLESVNKYKDIGFNKITYVNLNDFDVLYKIKNEMYNVDNVDITSSWSCNFEIMPRSVNKGYALNCLMQKLGIMSSEVVAFGDNDNDLPLLKAAGIGVAMANSNETLKKCADFITANNDEDGVALFLEKNIL